MFKWLIRFAYIYEFFLGVKGLSESIPSSAFCPSCVLFSIFKYLDKPGCFQSTLEMCQASSYTCSGTSGIITSPLFPSFPASSDLGGIECMWYINTPDNSYIRILFTNYTLPPPSTPCSESFVRLSEKPLGTPIIIGEYCSEAAPLGVPIDTSLNYVELEFITEPDSSGLIFMIEYEAAYFDAPAIDRSGNGTDTSGFYEFLIFGHEWAR